MFFTFVGLQLQLENRCSLVTIQKHAEWASLLFQVQVESNVMSELCKSVYVRQKLWRSSTRLLWTALWAAPITDAAEYMSGLQLELMSLSEPLAFQLSFRRRVYAARSTDLLIFILAACWQRQIISHCRIVSILFDPYVTWTDDSFGTVCCAQGRCNSTVSH